MKIYLAMEYWEVDGYYPITAPQKAFTKKENAEKFCKEMNKNLNIEHEQDFYGKDNYFFIKEMEIEN